MRTERSVETVNSILTAITALENSLSTSLGPRGCDKMIIGKETLITNDGATILKNFAYYHPINYLLTSVSKQMDLECGDGTTSVILLVTSLYLELVNLLNKGCHPNFLVKVLDEIKLVCLEYIDSVKFSTMNTEDYAKNTSKSSIDKKHFNREFLLQSVNTALSSKIIGHCLAEYAPVAVDACFLVNGNINSIQIVKRKGCLEDVVLKKSFVLSKRIRNSSLKKNATHFVKKGKIACLQFCVSAPKPNLDFKINVNNAEMIRKVPFEEREYLINLCQKIKKQNADIVLIQKSILRDGISELALTFLTKLEILVVDDLERDEISNLCKILNLSPSADPDCIKTVDAQICESEENYEVLTEILCDNAAAVVIRGAEPSIIDEAERSFHDALCVVRCLFLDPFLVPGGGAIEAGLSALLADYDLKNDSGEKYGKKYVYESISKAFAQLPYFLAKNAGLDGIIVNELLGKIKKEPSLGINVRLEGVKCMREENVIQPVKVSKTAVSLAIETVQALIKIDDVLPAKK